MSMIEPGAPGNQQAFDEESLERLFGYSEDLVPLWIAEPYVDLAPSISDVLSDRARIGWYGYEVRPEGVLDSFWTWMQSRHRWERRGLHTVVSPSVGTSIGVLIELLTDPGDGVVLQTPVFTDFKPIVTRLNRAVARNSLKLTGGSYRMDLENLAIAVAEPSTKMLILCNPHNPVGRVWTRAELAHVAAICAEHDVFVLADEIHADIVLPPHEFTPFGPIARESGTRWAATHGPTKTFGLAGVADTVLVTDDEQIVRLFEQRSSQLHLTRNNVFGITAFETAYRTGGPWLDRFLDLVSENVSRLRTGLPEGIDLIETEGTYLAWLDFRALGMDVPDLAKWLPSSARLALSPGHWFGREGAGFARMTIATPPEVIDDAIGRLTVALEK